MSAAAVSITCVVFLCINGGNGLSQEDRISKLETTLQAIAVKHKGIAKIVGDMDLLVGQDRRETRGLNKRLALLIDHEQKMAAEISKLKTEPVGKYAGFHTKGQMLSFQDAWSRKRQHSAATVCFTAVISQSDLTHLTAGQTLVFDQAITNVGSAYDVTSGVFNAPISGLYAFNMDAMVMPGEKEYLQIIKDGSHVMYNYVHASGALHDESSSRTVVLDLSRGNKVWIRTVPGSHHGSGNLHGNGFSTFSGWLLAATE